MDITHLDIDQLISVRARAQVAELPNKIKLFELNQNQNTLYNSFFDWAGFRWNNVHLNWTAYESRRHWHDQKV